jgi:hypothetical protein
MAALLENGMLSNADIRYIADMLTDTVNNEYLIKILVSDEDDEINSKFKEYIKSKNIFIEDKKRFLIKKIFQYILNGQIDLYESIKFIDFEIRDFEADKQIVGDSIGMEKIFGKFYLINDRDVTDPKEIKKLEEEIKQEMQNYIDNN